MHYLTSNPPTLPAHGTYHYYAIDKERAKHWLEQHHKELKLFQAVNAQIITALAQSIDRFISQEQQHTVPPQTTELKHGDELLVVLQIPVQPRPGFPAQNQPTIDHLSFALLTRIADHHP